MIGADDEAMIMDFGIARSTGSRRPAGSSLGANTVIRHLQASTPAVDATVFGAVIGTVAYMAPEQATGVQVDQRADMYALRPDSVRHARRPDAGRQRRESRLQNSARGCSRRRLR